MRAVCAADPTLSISTQIRSKASAEELSDFLDEMEREVGGQEVLRHFVQALLYVGSKSYTHLSVAIERYYGPLEARAGTEVRCASRPNYAQQRSGIAGRYRYNSKS